MSIDLSKQVLYSCHVSLDNRYDSGVFEMTVEDNIITISFRDIITRAGLKYYRTIPDALNPGSFKDVVISALSFPFHVVLYKVLDGDLGLELLNIDLSDSSDASPHTRSSWTIDLTNYDVADGDVVKVMVCGVLPGLNGVFYDGLDSALDSQAWKDEGKSNIYIIPDPDSEPVEFEGEMDDSGSPFEMLLQEGVLVNVDFVVSDIAYYLYSASSSKVMREWFSHIVGSEQPIPVTPTNRFFRTSCNNWKVYLADLFGGPVDSGEISIALYDTDARMVTITTDDLDENGYYLFSVTADGIYEVIVIVDSVTYTNYIFEYCQTEQCYLRLLNDIYCTDVDCCTGCSDEVIRDRMFKRNELAKLRMFMDEISFGIMHMRLSSIGMEGDAITDVIEKLVLYYARIREITARCGTCSDTTPISSPCNNCGQ